MKVAVFVNADKEIENIKSLAENNKQVELKFCLNDDVFRYISRDDKSKSLQAFLLEYIKMIKEDSYAFLISKDLEIFSKNLDNLSKRENLFLDFSKEENLNLANNFLEINTQNYNHESYIRYEARSCSCGVCK